MKDKKLVSLDEDIIEKLKSEKNASQLINDLLLDYYGENKDFKRIRILNRLKQLKKHEKELKEEKERIQEEVKSFQSNTESKKELIQSNKVKTFTRQGDMEKADREQEDEIQ